MFLGRNDSSLVFQELLYTKLALLSEFTNLPRNSKIIPRKLQVQEFYWSLRDLLQLNHKVLFSAVKIAQSNLHFLLKSTTLPLSGIYSENIKIECFMGLVSLVSGL